MNEHGAPGLLSFEAQLRSPPGMSSSAQLAHDRAGFRLNDTTSSRASQRIFDSPAILTPSEPGN